MDLANTVFSYIGDENSKKNLNKVKELRLKVNEEMEKYPYIDSAKVEALYKEASVYADSAQKELELLRVKNSTSS